MSNILYKIALTKISSVGPVLARELVHHAGSAREVFQLPRSKLLKVPGVGNSVADAVHDPSVLTEAEAELSFIDKKGIAPLFFTDEAYPVRLAGVRDAPILLYYKGEADLNTAKILAIVGTRKPTDYGLSILEGFLEGLRGAEILVLSGLAYGVDIAAHRGSLARGLETVGVLGSGFDRIYPHAHRSTAIKMLNQGGILTEFGQGTKPDREHFPMRNRIIAGMCDALLVVQSDARGGSMITADLANGYHKDVFAFPGRVGDQYSRGTNLLIKSHRAHLLEDAGELLQLMKWEVDTITHKRQMEIFADLSSEEKNVLNHFDDREPISIDRLYRSFTFTPSELANHLLNLEFKGMIRSLPGKRYQLLQ